MATFYIAFLVGNTSIDQDDFASYEPIECQTLEIAQEEAYGEALQEFLSYGGLHGYGETYEEFMASNPDASDDEYDEAQTEAANQWIDYHAITEAEWLALERY